MHILALGLSYSHDIVPHICGVDKKVAWGYPLRFWCVILFEDFVFQALAR